MRAWKNNFWLDLLRLDEEKQLTTQEEKSTWSMDWTGLWFDNWSPDPPFSRECAIATSQCSAKGIGAESPAVSQTSNSGGTIQFLDLDLFLE